MNLFIFVTMILIVSATSSEIQPMLGSLSIVKGVLTPVSIANRNDIAVLITGVGAVPTAYHLTRVLSSQAVTAVLGLGIAGSYNRDIDIGDVTLIKSDTFADYGIDDNGNFRSLFHESLANANQFPYSNGWMHCHCFSEFSATSSFLLKRVKAITVSTATGSLDAIQKLEALYSPDIETMEGAAIFYSCLLTGVPFACIRAISNRVEPRSKNNWNIPLAISNLHSFADQVLSTLP